MTGMIKFMCYPVFDIKHFSLLGESLSDSVSMAYVMITFCVNNCGLQSVYPRIVASYS